MTSILDRYVLGNWLRIFLVTTCGFPIVATLIDATDRLKTLLDRGVKVDAILLGYLYQIPEKVFEIIPAAVLVATVFTVGTLGRHSELTAAKAGGVSFHRLTLPIYVGAILAAGLTLLVGEAAPAMSARKLELHAEKARASTQRHNFVYRAEQGWVYTIRTLDTKAGTLKDVVMTRQGTGPGYPSLVVSADSATWSDRGWRLWHGSSRSVASGELQASFAFAEMQLAALREPPSDMLAEPKKPEEMRYEELGRYIDAVERSGNDAGRLRVVHALKLAIPATCIVIALFGAPLAMTSYRSGTAMGIGISLATTIVFLLLVQLSQAVGGSGLVDPTLAAWIPNGVFFLAATVLLVRART
ncbi:MAG TPA: LptF/LptG family permease [Gemmatimonadales bacterium]|nr:LptF/LptG family permease [Gemmatimonadales bacterium]